MRLSAVRLSSLLSLIAISAFAGQLALDGSDPERAGVIVEFRDAPGNRAAVTAHAADLARDLQAIHTRFRPAALSTDAAGAAPRIDHVYTHLLAGAAVSVPRAEVAALRALPYVARVSPDSAVKAMAFDGVTAVNAPKVWQSFSTRGAGVVIAVIDTGIDYHHDAFGNGFGPGHKVIGGYDFVSNDNDPMDESTTNFGHGTHVAGIIAGNGGGVLGVAPDASLIAYRVLDAYGTGKASTIIAALERAADPNQDGDTSDHVDIANLSLGGIGNPDDPLSRAVDAAAAAGIVVCVAAGNDGGWGNVGSPGASRSAITVGSANSMKTEGPFSSRGPIVQTLAMKPEVIAPGYNISSAKLGGGTIELSGTSMATPHVAGVAALLKSLHRDWTPAEIKSAIVSSVAGNEFGSGIGGFLDADAAARALVLPQPAAVTFGIVGSTAYARTVTLQLTNRGTETESLVGRSVAYGTNQGQITFDPPTVTIDPGQTKSVAVTLTTLAIDGAGPGFPSAFLRFQAPTTTVNVPWILTHGAAVTATYPSPNLFKVYPIKDGVPLLATLSRYASYLGEPTTGQAAFLTGIGVYDYLLIDEKANVMVAEQKSAEAATAISFSPADVTNQVTTSAVDVDGGPLDADHYHCFDHLTIFLPASKPDAPRYLDFAGILPQFQTSTISKRFTFVQSRSCSDTPSLTSYAIAFDPVIGVDHSLTESNQASDWFGRSVRAFLSSTDTLRSARQASWLSIANDYGWPQPDGVMPFPGGGVRVDLGAGTASQLFKLYVARGAAQTLLENRPCIQTASMPPGEYQREIIDGPCITVRDGKVAVPPVYPTYQTTFAASDSELQFGDGAVRPRRLLIPYGWADGMFTLEMGWFGAMQDFRYRDSELSDVTLYGPDGAAITPSSTDVFWRYYARDNLKPGSYRAVSIDHTYRTAGMPGRATLTATFDPSAADQTEPEISILQVRNGKGEIRSQIAADDTVQILFSLDDYEVQLYQRGRYDPVDTSATHLSLRLHGAQTWTDVPVRITGGAMQPVVDQFKEALPAGIDFRADAKLSPGYYDMKIEAQDRSGNRAELLLEPAFAVVAAGRGRAVQH